MRLRIGRRGRIAAITLALLLLVAVVALYWTPFLLMRHWQKEQPDRWPQAPTAIGALERLIGPQAELTSPDGRTRMRFAAGPSGLGFTVFRDGKPLIRPSRLGIILSGDPDAAPPATIEQVRASEVDKRWEQPWGEDRVIRDRHRELRIDIREAGERPRRYTLVARAFDDGIAFRYEMPAQPDVDGALTITGERTEFDLGNRDWQAWWIPAWGLARDEYITRQASLEALAAEPLARAVQTPLTLRAADGLSLSFHEAALRDYAGMVLAPQPGGRLRAQLVPWSGGKAAVRTRAPFHTPWRTVQIADRPAALMNSRMILNLNDPPAGQTPQSIKPMKYIGIWWGYITRLWDRTPGEHYGSTTARAKQHIDFAARHGIGGVLVESWNQGWEGWPGADGRNFSFTQSYPAFDLPAVAAYARQRGVALISHHETSGDIAHYESQLAPALDLLERHGIHYVKTGYVARQPGLRRVAGGRETREWQYGQFMVGHEWRLAEAARRKGVAIIAHEAVKDTGMRRTYPNFLARESARGQEYNGFDAVNGGNPPAHEATIAFTRMLAGPMDFTPGIFDLDYSDMPGGRGVAQRWLIRSRVNTTLAKQLALYVVLYSPVQMAADLIENYEREPGAFAFIKAVPTDWERSIALNGDIGQFAVIARRDRRSRDWYLGAITDGNARTIDQPLTFLEPGVRYRATIWADEVDTSWKRNAERYRVTTRIVTQRDRLSIEMGAGGGQAVRLQPLAR